MRVGGELVVGELTGAEEDLTTLPINLISVHVYVGESVDLAQLLDGAQGVDQGPVVPDADVPERPSIGL